MTRNQKLIYYVLASVVSISAWVWLFVQDWEIALAVLLILWGNNVTYIISNK